MPVDRITSQSARGHREQERRIGEVARADLEPLQSEPIDQEPQACLIERRREEGDIARAAAFEQPAVRLVVEFERLEHLVLALGAAGIAGLIFGLGGAARRQLVGAKGLELDDVGAGVGGGIDQLERKIEAPVVIDAGLGDRPSPPLMADLRVPVSEKHRGRQIDDPRLPAPRPPQGPCAGSP